MINMSETWRLKKKECWEENQEWNNSDDDEERRKKKVNSKQ